MESTEYANILQKVVETLGTEFRSNSVEKECILQGLFTRLEIIAERKREVEVVKRLTEVVLRSKDRREIDRLLAVINSPF